MLASVWAFWRHRASLLRREAEPVESQLAEALPEQVLARERRALQLRVAALRLRRE